MKLRVENCIFVHYIVVNIKMSETALHTDAKKAVDEEKNQLKASRLWQKHLGNRFPDGEDKDEKGVGAETMSAAIGGSRPYYGL